MAKCHRGEKFSLRRKQFWLWMSVSFLSFDFPREIKSKSDELTKFYSCRYINGTHYLQEKYGYEEGDVAAIMDTWFNLGISFVFPLGLFFLNLVLYLIPLPAFVKAKFRE